MPDADTKSSEVAKLCKYLANFDASQIKDYYLRAAVVHVSHAAKLMPMSEVLAQVKGKDVFEKAEHARVSRSTWYAWKRGKVRPNEKQAARLAELTKIPAEKFAGRR